MGGSPLCALRHLQLFILRSWDSLGPSSSSSQELGLSPRDGDRGDTEHPPPQDAAAHQPRLGARGDDEGGTGMVRSRSLRGTPGRVWGHQGGLGTRTLSPLAPGRPAAPRSPGIPCRPGGPWFPGAPGAPASPWEKREKQGLVRDPGTAKPPRPQGVRPSPATPTAVPQQLGTVPCHPATPSLAPTLAPSLPGAPLAPRGPWGPGGPWTPRSPGKPLSPWGGEAGQAPRPSGTWGGTLGCPELRGARRGFSLPWHRRDRGLQRLRGHPEGEGDKSEGNGWHWGQPG